jgi:hypothetical protein
MSSGTNNIVTTVTTVTLSWRSYGSEIEWMATFDPEPHTRLGAMFKWRVSQSSDTPVEDDGQQNRGVLQAVFDLGVELSRFHVRVEKLIVQQIHHGLRTPPRRGNLDETGGSFCDDGLSIEFGGACPIQGNGTLDGHPCYYRARGREWTFHVWDRDAAIEEISGLPTGEPIFCAADLDAYAWPDGSWLHRDVSLANLASALVRWREARSHFQPVASPEQEP